jgi:hypothetical protein
MNDTDFTAVWTRMDSPPPSGTRCLITDGDVVVIATYLTDNETKKVMWICNELCGGQQKMSNVQGWMPLPRPIPKLVKVNDETTVAKDKATN